MNADKFFEKYSIEEISQKTKISPISLRFIRNKEFDKIPRAKFFGFVNIIEKEFKVDLSDLKEEYNAFKPKEKEKTHEIKIEKNSNNYLISILAIILLIIGGYILYKTLKGTPKKTQSSVMISNNVNTQNIVEENISANEENLSTEQNSSTNENTTLTKIQNKTKDFNNPKQSVFLNNTSNNLKENPQQNLETNNTKQTKTITEYPVIIIPNKLVWFRAKNIDTNKTFEYLTSKEKILPKGNYYIKFGHGDITINYANQTIQPNTKKIIRILFKDGNYTFLKKPNRYEK